LFYVHTPCTRIFMISLPSDIILVGREGFQPRPLFQEDC